MSDSRKELRKSKIQARNSLSQEEWERLSAVISERLASSDAFRDARTVLIYRATKGEVRLDALERANSIPMEPWDKPMEMVFAEACIYFKKTGLKKNAAML